MRASARKFCGQRPSSGDGNAGLVLQCGHHTSCFLSHHGNGSNIGPKTVVVGCMDDIHSDQVSANRMRIPDRICCRVMHVCSEARGVLKGTLLGLGSMYQISNCLYICWTARSEAILSIAYIARLTHSGKVCRAMSSTNEQLRV